VKLRQGGGKRPGRPKPYADHLQEKKMKEVCVCFEGCTSSLASLPHGFQLDL